MNYGYPLRFEYKPEGLLVEFTGLKSGTVIIQGKSANKAGQYLIYWVEHTNSLWTPVAYSKRIQLHNKIKDFR